MWPGECCPTPLQWLCEVTGYWRELEEDVLHVNPEHPKHAQWEDMSSEYAGHGRTGTFSASRNSVQILATWICIIMLKHEVMAADEWHDNEPQDLVMVSLCIQIAIAKCNCVCCP